MGKATNLGNLIAACREYGTSSASDKRWKARRGHITLPGTTPMPVIIVTHHKTDMIAVDAIGSAVPISPGWGSATDKQSIGKILSGTGQTYDMLFNKGNIMATVVDGPYPSELDYSPYTSKPAEPKVVYSRFVPPLSVKDTIM